jgi:arylsulfatase A-like enzyme
MNALRRLAAVLLTALPAAVPIGGCGETTGRPNVVFLVLDTVRRDHLGCYGYGRATTPNIDRLAADAVVYENAVASAPWTLPSHASFFTGLPPSRHHAHHEHLGLDAEHVTMAEHLARLGYETIGVCNNPWVTLTLGMTQGFGTFHEIWRNQVSHGGFDLNVFVDPGKHGMTDAGAKAAIAEIDRWLGERRSGRSPFFLFINLIEAHSFYDPPESHRNLFTTRRLDRRGAARLNIDFVRHAFGDSMDAAETREILALYDAEIAYLDDRVGELLEMLRKRELLDETLLVVTSDHGEAFGEHELCGIPLIDHQLSLHAELLDIPLIIRYPPGAGSGDRAGRRVAHPVSAIDLLPTILEAAGATVPDSLPGTSLLHGPPAPDRTLFAEYYRPIVHLGLLHGFIQDERLLSCLVDRRLASAQTGGHKWIVSSDGSLVGYDIAADPGERRPLDAEPTSEAIARAALDRLAALGSGPRLAPPKLDAALEATLRSLGYLK